MIQSAGSELAHIAIHSADDFIIVLLVDLGILHIPPGEFLGQNFVKYIILIVGDGIVDSAVAVCLGRDIFSVPFFHKNFHTVLPAQTEELALQIIVGFEAVFSPGGIQNPVPDICQIQQKPEFSVAQIDLHGVPPEDGYGSYYSKEKTNFQMEIVNKNAF
jgi:hypothetical protein